jgi:hypothetical protein
MIPQASAAGLSIQVSGNTLINGSGQIVIPRGVNRSGTEYRCIQNTGIFDGQSDAASVQAIKNWTNVNVVRLPLNEDCWLGLNTDTIDPAYVGINGANYRSAISSYVDLLTQNGLYTMLDLHWSAPGAQQATAQLPMPDAEHSPAFWTSVADTFKTNPAVMFELFNEPYPDGNRDTEAAWTCLRDGGTCSGISYQVAGMQTLVNSIRATGATNVIVVPGVGWAGIMSQWLGYKPTDTLGQLAASHHRYRTGWCATISCWNSELAPIAQQVPLITSEMGEDANDVNCTHAFIDDYMAWADAKRIGYLAWTWNIWGSTHCMDLITSYGGTPSPYGQRYKSHLAPLFSDDFNDGTADGWSSSPLSYWSVASGELKTTGATVGGWSWQTAEVTLPAAATEFEARLATSATTISNHGIAAMTADQQYQVLLAVDQGNMLRWSTSSAGAWSGWVAAGSIDRTAFHTYAIRRDSGSVFSVLVDGAVMASGIVVDPPSVWANGIGAGALFTQAELQNQVLDTRFDDVAARQ